MSQAEELLDSVANDGTTYDTVEPHIVVGPNRIVIVPDELKKIAVQFDHDVKTVTFDCPRYSDGRDLSTMRVYINYTLADGTDGACLAENVTVDETDDLVMHFDWIITRNVTPVDGNLSFTVCIKNTDGEGNEINHWNSEPNEDAYIAKGKECTEQIVDEYPDVIGQILDKVNTIESEFSDALDELHSYAQTLISGGATE